MEEPQSAIPTQRRRRGRPALLTPEREKRLFEAMEIGTTYTCAAGLAGISFDTFNRWRKQGQQEDAAPEFRDFCDRLRMAEARAEYVMVRKIYQAADKYWPAAAWMLERKYPATWGKKDQITVAATAEGAPELKRIMTDEQMLAAMEATVKRLKQRQEKQPPAA